MFDEHYIEDLTGLKARSRLEFAGYYAKLNETDKVEAHRRQVEVFRVWRSQNKTERTKDAEKINIVEWSWTLKNERRYSKPYAERINIGEWS